MHVPSLDLTYHHSSAFALLYLQLVTVLPSFQLGIMETLWHVNTRDTVCLYDMSMVVLVTRLSRLKPSLRVDTRDLGMMVLGSAVKPNSLPISLLSSMRHYNWIYIHLVENKYGRQ